MKHNSNSWLTVVLVSILMVVVGGSASAITRDQLATYAKSLQGLNKAELKTAIYNLCQPAKVLDYGSGAGATWSGFVKTDRIGTTLECRNRYSSDRFYFTSATQNSAISGMNIEHSFPKSWWGGAKNKAYKDLYNLYPSESKSNSKKSNYVMGEVTDASVLDDYEKVGTGEYGSFRVVEPHDNWKGDFCRSYFYMVTVYQNLTWESEGTHCLQQNTWPTLQKWAYELYLKWTRTDKVDEIEIDRNNTVYSLQGNRNLFIDYPYLAEYVWGDSTDVGFDPNSSVTTASDDDRYNGTTTPDKPDGPTTVSVPTFSPAGGTYTEAQTVNISSATAGATIYYTIDGSMPTAQSNLYTSAITISQTTTLRAIAVKEGVSSKVSSATYIINAGGSDAGNSNVYVKVTSNDQLVAGKKYLIVYEDGSKALSDKASSKNYRTGADVTISNNIITTETNTSGKPNQITLGGTVGAWTLYDAKNNTYLGLTSNDNSLNNVASGANGSTWTIDVTADNIISNDKYNDRYLQYNTNSPRFACYKLSSSQKPIALYVQREGAVGQTSAVRYKSTSDDEWHYLLPDENGAYNITDGNYSDLEVTEDVTNATVNYTRSFNKGVWAAWNFPIDMIVDADFINNYCFGYLEGVSNESSDINKDNLTGVTIGVKMLTAGKTVMANLPYVVLPQISGSKTFTLTGTLKKTEPQSTQITGNAYKYISTGVYSRKNYDNDFWYALTSEGMLSKAASDAYLNPFRFYLTIVDREDNPYFDGPEVINLVIEDETTGINNVSSTKSASQTVYDLQGRKLIKPVGKGIYIVNGHKVVLTK